MEQVFEKVIAERLAGSALRDARIYLLRTLCEATGIPLELRDNGNSIHHTDIGTLETTGSPFELTWKVFISSSDYRDDGVLVFGAHLFPLIGGIRTCLLRTDKRVQQYDFAFRYLMLTKEEGWKDLGWQLDENGEFEHRYCDCAR